MESRDIETLTHIFLNNGIQDLESQLDSLGLQEMPRLDVLDDIRKASENVGEDVSEPLDRMHEIYEACVSQALAIADGKEELVQYANATSYNLSANLADCWSDDPRTRSPRHFEAGIAAAKRCLELRRQLNRSPTIVAMAYFILGVHEYALHNFKTAEDAWLSKLENEMLDLENPSQAETDLNVILSHGLIGLARMSLGSGDNKDYIDSLARLESLRNPENTGEIDLFKSELQLLKEKHFPFD